MIVTTGGITTRNMHRNHIREVTTILTFCSKLFLTMGHARCTFHFHLAAGVVLKSWKKPYRFLDDAKPEAAAATALLLFAHPDVEMPGGYTATEFEATSPFIAISNFPQELVLLGRATILIKGIAKQQGLTWSLGDKWKHMAEQALTCGTDGCRMPAWSEPVSGIPTPADLAVTAGSGRVRLGAVVRAYGETNRLALRWVVGRGRLAADRVGRLAPGPVKRAAVRFAADVAARRGW